MLPAIVGTKKTFNHHGKIEKVIAKINQRKKKKTKLSNTKNTVNKTILNVLFFIFNIQLKISSKKTITK